MQHKYWKSIFSIFAISTIWFLALLLAGNVWGSNDSAKASFSHAARQSAQTLSTPQLIALVYDNGEISADERLLYLAYAIYDAGTLPSRFQSDVGWSGTESVAQIYAEVDREARGQRPAFVPEIEAALNRLLSPEAKTVCDQQDGPNNTETANFHVNYGSIEAGLSIDDYTSVLEHVFTFEVNNYGWGKPPFCTAGTGTCTQTNPWNKYPVQIAPGLAGGLYGYVGPSGGIYTGRVGDNPNTTATESQAYATCIVLNNEYTIAPELTPLEELQRTAAHEFNHTIQRGYSGGTEESMWRESTSSYVEDEVYDSLDANRKFLWPPFSSCLGEFNPDGRYANWIFLRYIAEHNGGTNLAGGGEDVMQTFWEQRGIGDGSLKALNTALGGGAGLADAYHDYAIATRFLKTCPAATPYCYEEAAGYVNDAGKTSNHGKIAAVGGSYSGTLQDNYALNWIELPNKGIYSVSIVNKSANGKFRVSIVADTGTGLEITPFPELANGNLTVTLPQYEPPDGAKSVVAVITNEHQTADDPGSCTANPYKLIVSPPVAFVIDDTGSMGEEIGAVKTTVTNKVDEFVNNDLYPNYDLITFKDNVTYRGETEDPDEIKAWVDALYASGGGDCPEEMLGALDRLAIEAPHSEAWVMTDAGFHGTPIDLATTIYNLVAAHVKLHPIVYSWCFYSPFYEGGDQSDGQFQPQPQTGLGPESFAQIARETGGHYFSIASSETNAVASILLNEMIMTSDLSQQYAILDPAGTQTFTVSIDDSMSAANFLLNGLSNDYGQSVSLTVIDPAGNVIIGDGDDVVYIGLTTAEYYQITSPMVGAWQLVVMGSGDFAVSASGQSEISFAYLSDTSLAVNKPAVLKASLDGPIETAEFQIVYSDGVSFAAIDLYDDGLHEDNDADDGVYAGAFTPDETGDFYLTVHGDTLGSAAYERISTELIRIQGLDLAVSPENQTTIPGSEIAYAFVVTNLSPITETYDILLTSSQAWADVGAVPSEITVTPGASTVITVPVVVPANAPRDTVDKTVMVISSQSNPLINDTVAVYTRVSVEADLEIKKTASITETSTAIAFSYTLEVTNHSTFTATDVTAVDALPNELSILSLDWGQGGCVEVNHTITCDFGTVAAGATVTVNIVVSSQVTGHLINVATVTSSEIDPILTNNTDTASVTIKIRLYWPIIFRH